MVDEPDRLSIKIKRAKEQIGQLESAIGIFLKSRPYAAIPQDDEQAGQVVVSVHVRQHPPLIWGAIAGDVVHNLRSALDHLWRRAWYPGGGGLRDFKCEFPIVANADALEARFRSIDKGRKKAIVDLAKTIKPYESGDDDLWRLDRIDQINKHRLLIPAYTSITMTTVDVIGSMKASFPEDFPAEFPPMRIGISMKEPLCPVTDGAVVYRCPLKDKATLYVGMKPEFPLDIAFGEGEAVKGKPVIPTLSGAANAVEEVLSRFLEAKLIS